ncbi:cytidylyltransferase domain-containing protein [Spirochaetota bacterium]
MYKGKSYLGIIPARSGSKRLSDKNICDLCGKPLIAWTIEASLQSKYIDETLVTTDSDIIANISRKYGGQVPFKRPARLATDTATSVDVVLHVLGHYKSKLHKEFDYIVFLQPTSPLRDHSDINRAIELCDKKSANAIISVCEAEHSPLHTNILPKSLSMNNFISKKDQKKRYQDIHTYYQLNGAIYICRTDIFIKEKSFFPNKKSFAFIIPKERSVDIDTRLDFIITECIIKNRD